jgi:NAD(P)-dependent dehydrogenase (short-subunit alcohol dehydrogenase family)
VDDIFKIFSLAGKRALITGASAGIGQRMAHVLARAGAKTIIVARRADLLARMASENSNFIPIEGDLSGADNVRQVARQALEAVGSVDILVNNAAYIAGGVRAEDETHEQITATLAVNLIAPILLAQAFMPGMRDQRSGTIINVSSIVASVGIGSFPQAVYSASKGGLQAITREWVAQWSRHGIRVNNLAPGFIESEMNESVIHSENVQAWIHRNTLIKRHGVPSDFDGALLFLASAASSYVTGQTLTVDGGWTSH